MSESDTPTRMRGTLIGPLPEPEGTDQSVVDRTVPRLEEVDQS